ncbi:MAG: AsmA 2 protein, partial [Bacteroidota bacterium]|nr:AsmA 2 protein [Bacteroidota bacterium]
LRRFPKASLDLKNVVVHSSPGFDQTCFNGINTDTLLIAGSVSAEFSLSDIIKGIYNIDRIGVKNGYLNLYSDTSGYVNYDIEVENEESAGSDFLINLERINLSDIRIYYNNQATKLITEGLVEAGRLKSRITEDEIDFNATGIANIELFRLFSFSIVKSINAEFNVNLHSTDEGVLFDKSSVSFDNYSLELTGSVSSDNVLDMVLSGKNIDITGIKKYFPDKYLEKISAYNPSGILNIDGKFTGVVSRTLNPKINISFDLKKGAVTYANSALTLKDLSVKGFFINGSEMVPRTSELMVSEYSCSLGSANYSGSFALNDFNHLKGTLGLKGKMIPSELKEFFNLKEISSAEGAIDIDLKMSGYIPKKEKYTINDFFELNPDVFLKFYSFGIGIQNDKIFINQATGDLFLSDTVTARNLKFTFRDHIFNLDGRFYNLPGWLSGKGVVLSAIASVSCSSLNPEVIFPGLSSTDSSTNENKAYSLPGDIVLDLDFKIGDVIYKSFSAQNIAGNLSYKPGICNFKTLNLNSMDGAISGNGFVVQNKDKSFIGRGSFTFGDIDVNKMFKAFRNFGQGFIKAENLSGNLSGALSVLIPMDSLLNPVIKSVTAEGKFVLVKGGLLDFDPVKELSSFIEISELENISFDRLENDFFIRNNFLYMPLMDVKSSAADLTVNGKHSFDNDYEYHVRVLLSEILSKKIRKPKPNTTEFGAIKDDGLGRTSLLLKITGKAEDVKVGYDVKAAGNQIKNDMKNERQTLKSILNQEYGWFKNDTSLNKKQETAPPRFKISWGDEDSTKVVTEPPAERKESPVMKLFKK